MLKPPRSNWAPAAKADVLLFDFGVRIASAEFESFKTPARDDVRHAGYGLGAVQG